MRDALIIAASVAAILIVNRIVFRWYDRREDAKLAAFISEAEEATKHLPK